MSQITLEPETRSKARTIISQLFATYYFDAPQFPLPLHRHITLNDFQMFLGEVNDILGQKYHQCKSPSQWEQTCMRLYKKTNTSLIIILYMILVLISTGMFVGLWFVPFHALRITFIVAASLTFGLSMIVIFFRVFLIRPTRSGLRKCEDERLEQLKTLIRERNQYFEPKGVQFNLQIKERERTLSVRGDRRHRDVHWMLTKAPTLVIYVNNDVPQQPMNTAPQQQQVPSYYGSPPQNNVGYPSNTGYAQPQAPIQDEKQEPVHYQQPGNGAPTYGSYHGV
eukprot:CAMPEP_0117442384 /NCGR_PEP_ID=MMETSP0759-20121206/4122_1 /TAXON_ID=63605 /ORGANISM="Percolomonas cosmopolitus, Strain WS" /LENGTH=280 /DNA_ID=CAMNT_0005234267 /DNA_START=30 /DNA_END=872 /DNA_ORIENTATION=+